MKIIAKGSQNGAEINARTGIEKDQGSWKKCFLALVGITGVKDTSVIKKDKKNNESG